MGFEVLISLPDTWLTPLTGRCGKLWTLDEIEACYSLLKFFKKGSVVAMTD